MVVTYVPGPYGPIVLASGIPTTAWNPSDNDSQTTLSNGNLTRTGTVGSFAFTTTRAVASATTGKKYSEHTVTAANGFASFMGLGLSVAGMALTTSVSAGGGASKHIGWAGDGNVYTSAGGGAAVATIQAYAQGDTVCMAVDFGNSRIWFRTNGGNWNNSALADPATNVGGINFASETGAALFPTETFLVFSGVAQVATANFGTTAYTQSVPSGFGNYV